MKIGAVDTEIALLIVKKEEINASKIDSPSGKFAERAKKNSINMEDQLFLLCITGDLITDMCTLVSLLFCCILFSPS